MRNFDYLKEFAYLADLYGYCSMAEAMQVSNPDVSALNARRALEWLVRAIYEMKGIVVDGERKRASLFELVDGEPFTSFVGDERIMMGVHYIRKVGNSAAHTGSVSRKESFFALLNLYNFVGVTLIKLRVIEDFEPLNKGLIPTSPSIIPAPSPEPQPSAEFVESIAVEQIEDTPVEVRPLGLTEAETRRYFIDMMLKEAGWDILETDGVIAPLKACVEVKVEGMPSDSGVGYADYVLFGANGKPLAVVEAKRTSVDISVGRQQAKLYADCLEAQYGVRPVIYCTNGYHTEVVDGLGYPAREVYGYHTAEELELLIQRRGRSAITDLHIKDEITNREYQKRAIRQVCERFNANHRRTLLVMATGTGKTRVSISLVEVLMRNGWVKNVLFLADRTALVKQAAKNYTKLLPSATTCILSEEKEPDMSARIMFSTYQTMIKYIDSDSKAFSVGRFDLVIIDEAHRSVFGKYTAIFDYFDCLLVGLTATPRDEVERNTFDLFSIEAEDTFAYEHKEAVEDGYLVPFNALKRGTAILKRGIIYNSLSAEEKEQLEAVWKYEKARKALDDRDDYHRNIESKEIFKYIFNVDTIDKVLQDLMQCGQKVQSGERIGKTIIFGYNHNHADLIVQRFKALYPEYGEDFCVLVDNYVNYAQSIIDNFEIRDNMPQIAVSVDMLDTGIDVPDILNLVFFKPIHSLIKFTQMIGRGTRLSQNIFGDGKDKECFYIFDWCGNFEYFSLDEKGKEPLPTQSLTERIFCVSVDLAVALQHATYQEDAFAKGLHDRIKESLHSQVINLKDSHISVRKHWETVDKFRNNKSWEYLSSVDAVLLKDEISPLLIKSTSDENAKKFDLLMLNIELSKVAEDVNSTKSQRKVVQIGQLLQERASIPQVAAKMSIIKEVVSPVFWEKPSLKDLERVREELRELVKFITGGDNRTFTLNIEDMVIEMGVAEDFAPVMTYKQRVIDYLAKNRDLPTVQKIINIEQLDHNDIVELERILWKELGTKEDYAKYIERGNMLCGDSVAIFIRSIVGVDRSIAIQKFSDFLSDSTLNSEQEEYLKSIITYVCKNGDITAETIVNEPPFSDFEWLDTFGQNFIYVRKYIDVLHNSIVG